MLGVGQKFPEFNLTATVSLDRKNAFKQLTNKDFAGKWRRYLVGNPLFLWRLLRNPPRKR